MRWTEIPANELHAAEQRLRVALGDNAEAVVQRINADPTYVQQVADYIVISARMPDKLTTSLNTQWLRAREIMGRNFFGVEEAIKHFGVNPIHPQLASLAEIPFSEAVLEELKYSHILVAVFPLLSILEIRGKVDSKLFCYQSWYNKEPFAKEQGEVSWQLVRKTPVPDSISKNWQEQQSLLGKDDEMPTAQVMVYTIIGHYLETGERLFERIYVRTSSVDYDGSRVFVGSFGLGGLSVYRCRDDHHYGDLGISSARKSLPA